MIPDPPSWPRLFEFNDSEWVPTALRETLVESLSRTLLLGRALGGLVEPFARFLDQAGTSEVLDLCSGAGGPAGILVTEFEHARRRPPRFLLTDLAPRVAAWERLREQHPGSIDYVASAIDATRVPPALGRSRVRVIVNALHHFPPDLAGAILCAAATESPGVFVAESLVRDPLQLLAMVPAGLPALLANPAVAPEHRIAKAVLTWLTPIALATAAWDVGVSMLRVYGERDLRALVAPLGTSVRWTYGTYRYPPFGRGTYFYGVRHRRAARSNTTQAPQRVQSTSLP